MVAFLFFVIVVLIRFLCSSGFIIELVERTNKDRRPSISPERPPARPGRAMTESASGIPTNQRVGCPFWGFEFN